MKKYSILLFVFVLFISSACFAIDIKVIKSENYELSLEPILIKANTSYTEIHDIDSIREIIPEQIIATVQTGDWVSNLPNAVFVSFQDGTCDKISEYWDISFAKVNNGNVIFTRTITNNDSIDRNAYSWDIKIAAIFLKLPVKSLEELTRYDIEAYLKKFKH